MRMKLWMGGLAVMLLEGGCECRKSSPAVAAAPSACPAPSLEARPVSSIQIDGKLDERAWLAAVSSGAFSALGKGGALAPHSELRAVWTSEALVLAMYAADEDLRADDAFVVSWATAGAPVTVRITVKGELSCVSSTGACVVPPGVRAAAETDDSIDDASDFDEEWQVELSIPWSAFGATARPTAVKVNASRTDTPRNAQPRTTAWACASLESFGTISLVP